MSDPTGVHLPLEPSPRVGLEQYRDLIEEITRLKRERNAIVLAHNYQAPEIYRGVADITGDSLALAREAATTDADVIVVAGVHFMAETAKLLNPSRTVLIPDLEAGCSLASSITANDVRILKAQYPGVPVVTYVNTSAAVKAESDVCCTSANVLKIVEGLKAPRVIVLPDEYLASYVAARTTVEIIAWHGRCEVHERFDGPQLRSWRQKLPGVAIVAHPECPPDVLAEADFIGSTTAMARHVAEHRPRQVILVTECSMSDNVAAELPDVEFLRPCNLCPHMQRITLAKIRDALTNTQHEILIEPDVASRARRAVERMLELSTAGVR